MRDLENKQAVRGGLSPFVGSRRGLFLNLPFPESFLWGRLEAEKEDERIGKKLYILFPPLCFFQSPRQFPRHVLVPQPLFPESFLW